MTSKTMLLRWVDKTGWDPAAQLDKLLEFVEERGQAVELDRFLGREALYERLQPYESEESDLLDDDVQDANAHVESDINNEGFNGQLDFLIEQLGVDDVEALVGEILKEKKEKLWPKQKPKRGGSRTRKGPSAS